MRLRTICPISFVDAYVAGPAGSVAASIRVSGGRVDCLDSPPLRGDTVVDLGGDLVLPGFINAHDHLDLNNFPRLKWRDRYDNAREWIADFQPRFKSDPALLAPVSVPIRDRLILGGIKNLLSGATTVSHHNPFHRLLRRGFPVRVPHRYRYSHSLLIDGEAVRDQYRDTPGDWPWIIHAAEGTDAAAAEEFDRLKRWNCIGQNTVLVHGVGLGHAQMADLLERGGGLVWCPSSNDFLLGKTADVAIMTRARRVALGTDSRLSGGRDLLEEMKHAARCHGARVENLLHMVTVDAAALLRLPDAGEFRPGAPADLIVLPKGSPEPLDGILSERSRIRLVLLGGKPAIGDPDMMPVFASSKVTWMAVRLDGKEKLMTETLVDRLKHCAVSEPGLEL
jgi:hypothetical protein